MGITILAVKLNFQPYNRRYTSPNENFEYSYPLNIPSHISNVIQSNIALHPQVHYILQYLCRKARMASKTKPSTTTNETRTPPYMEMISDAIAGLKEAKGSTKPAIMKYIFDNYGIQSNSFTKRSLDNALQTHVKNRSVKQIKAAGSCVLYKLDEILEPSAAIGKTSKIKVDKVVKSVRVSDSSSSKKTTATKAKTGTTGTCAKAQNASKRKQETALPFTKQERPWTRSGRKPNTSQTRIKVSQEKQSERKTKQPVTDDKATFRKTTEVVKPFDRAEVLDIASGSERYVLYIIWASSHGFLSPDYRLSYRHLLEYRNLSE